jgi:glycerol kinase
MRFILALDQGTTSSRAVVFDANGKPVAVAQKEFEQHFPKPGWVEHDPNEIWSSQSAVAVEAMAAARIHRSDLAAIGITNQRETTVVWDRRTGEPIGNAIVWQDRRTAPMCDRLRAEGLSSVFQKKTGLIIDPYFSGTKLRWILDNIPNARAEAERGNLAFGTVDAWLVWKLSEGRRHVTDVSNASRTLLFNIHTQTWDDELLQILGIPRSLLPDVASSSEIYAEVGPETFAAGVPIAGIAGDQQAALFGQTCFTPGMAKNTYGTGCFLLMNTGEKAWESRNRLVSTIAWRMGGRTDYALEGSVFVGGAVVQWLRDGLGILKNSADVESLAASVPDNGGAYFVPAFTGLGAPHWDAHARGTIIGLSRGTNAGHIARAALEGIAYQSYDVLKAMELDSGIPLRELRVDGGACRNDLLMQFQADLLQVPVVRPKQIETTVLGAAYLAGLAVGYWESIEQIAEQWSAERVFEPQRTADEVGMLHARWTRAVERASDWAQE